VVRRRFELDLEVLTQSAFLAGAERGFNSGEPFDVLHRGTEQFARLRVAVPGQIRPDARVKMRAHLESEFDRWKTRSVRALGDYAPQQCRAACPQAPLRSP
jgi:hypothetical protein